MNERVKELADQAELTIRTSTGTYMSHPEFNRKFAELIICECLNQCYNRGMNDELYAGQLRAAEYIENYFGIE